jgi:hypothetical protein
LAHRQRVGVVAGLHFFGALQCVHHHLLYAEHLAAGVPGGNAVGVEGALLRVQRPL